jgi:hypothetical protein
VRARGDADGVQPGLVRVVQIGGVVARTVVEAAQQPVALAAHAPDLRDHAPDRDAQHQHRVRGEHQARLERVRNDLGRARLQEALEAAVVARAHDDRQRGADFVRMVQHAQGGRDVGVGDDECRRTLHARGDERLAARGVAEDHRVAGRRGLADALGIQIERDVPDPLPLEKTREALAGPTVPADHHVPLGRETAHGDLVQLQRPQHPLRPREPQRDPVAVVDEKRCGEHRQQHARHDRLRQRQVHHLDVQSAHDEDQPELACLGEREAAPDRGPGGRSAQARKPGDQGELQGHRHHEDRQHERKVVRHDPQVELHPHRDEEQAQQHLAEGLDVLLDLVPVLGLRDEHSGDERTEGQREAGELREIREAQRDEQHVDDEQLVRAAPRDQREPGPHQPLPDEQHHHQHGGGFQPRQREVACERFPRPGERRNEDQQRHHGKVLEQQHADRVPAVRRLRLEALHEQADHDRRGGHREGPRQHDRRLPRGPESKRDRREHGHGEHDLRAAQPEHHATHLDQPRQAELEPEGEHEEDDAELRQLARRRAVGDPAERVRTDRDADDQVAEQRRQVQTAENHHDEHRAREQDQHQFESVAHRVLRAAGER